MILPLQAQLQFLELQIRESEDEYRSYALSPIQNLRSEQRIHVGRIYSMDSVGNVILRFKKDECPRLKVPYELLIYDADRAGLASGWRCSLFEFKRSYVDADSELEPIYYLNKVEDNYRYMGCMGLDIYVAHRVRVALDKGVYPTLLLAEPPPPVEYFQNLQAFITANPRDSLLNLLLEKDLSSWKPKPLTHDMPKATVIIDQLEETTEAIVQGPPGTGKTHLVSEIIQQYADAGKNVVVTALANKALIELAKSDILTPLRTSGRVSKTRLTTNEAAVAKGLVNAKDLNCSASAIMLATYFKLSRALLNPALSSESFQAPYDLLVIEEASQAFLATIAGFRRLAHHILIVGDPLQLPPIVKAEEKAQRIHPRITAFAEGLETVAANTNYPAFILCDTYRLTDAAAKLTGIFYENRLRSQRKSFMESCRGPLIQRYFSDVGGTTILPLQTTADADKDAVQLVQNLLAELLEHNKQLAVAVLSPKRTSVRMLQNRLRNWTGQAPNLTIETVDRIQGLTVDYCIYFLPSDGGVFALNLKRFNVATSRSKGGTLIIANEFFIRYAGSSTLVKKYLSACEILHD